MAAEVDVEVSSGDKSLPARTTDISAGGLCIEIPEALPFGSDVILTLSLVFDENTMSEPLKICARVVWCTQLDEKRFQLGTSFASITNQSRGYLNMFLRYLSQGAPA